MVKKVKPEPESRTVTEEELEQVARANESAKVPVVFVHGLWLLPSSWDRWADLFEKAGYCTLSPGWPDDPDTVEEANAHPEVMAGKSVGEVADYFCDLIGKLDQKPAIVGHSFGGSVLLKYLAEGRYQEPIIGLFLVSTPFWGSDFPDFALPDGWAAAVWDIPTFLYHSRDDPEIPLSHLRRYEEHLPNATSRVIDGSQHSFTDGLPQLVRDIRASITPR